MDPTWIAAVVFVAIAFAVAVAPLVGARLLRVVARDNPTTKFTTYECGEVPDGLAWLQFHPRYYVVALVFVLFDVETVFILPWALNIRAMGDIAIIEMFVFIFILMLGWVYALRKGALKWQ